MMLNFFGQIGLGKACRPRSDCSDQDLQCLPCCLHFLDSLLYGRATLLKLLSDYSKFLDVRSSRIFMVLAHNVTKNDCMPHVGQYGLSLPRSCVVLW